MNGKILKIYSNDLYGNVDDRQVVVFAVFMHIKYMNRYVIFTFKDEYEKNKLYFGSVHVKENSLVIFAIRNEVFKYVSEFINQYLSSSINKEEYEIKDISKIEKVELVSYNNMECNDLLKLDELSISKEKYTQEVEDKDRKPVFLYCLIIFLILLLGGLTYLYLNPDAFMFEYKMLNCNVLEFNNQLDMSYNKNTIVKFDNKDRVNNIEIIDKYVFSSNEIYQDFKVNNRQNDYFNIDGVYKYDDDNLELRIIYNDNSIIESYDEMFGYLEKEGYDCVEGKYYE